MTPVAVSAIILNWNSAPDTVQCARAVAESADGNVDIVVVDNASMDGSETLLRMELGDRYPIIQTRENLGYAAGNRVGVQYALAHDAEFVWIVNPDCFVQPDTLGNLLAAAERHGDLGIFSPLLLHYDTPSLVYFGGAYFEHRRGRPAMIQHVALSEHLVEEHACASIHGANVLIPIRVIRQCGFMDERFFLYGEEMDYSMRLGKHGVPSVYVPSARAYHKSKGSMSHDPVLLELATYYRRRNHFLIWRRNLPASRAARLVWQRVGSEIRWWWRHLPDDIPSRYRMAALWHGLTGRFGKTFDPASFVPRGSATAGSQLR